jgi:dTDP-4-dehydrorhamnose reductase
MARVAITGAAGQLGRQLVPAFEAAGHEVRGLSHAELDIADPADADALRSWRPAIVVNAAAWTDVDGCARDPDRAMRVNGEAAGRLAELAASWGALSVQVSTNEVFDGSIERPYREHDDPAPINAYGRSKLVGEREVAAANPHHLIVRTAWLFGPGGNNFVTKIVAAGARAAAAGEPLRLVDDEWGNPTWTPDLAAAIARMAIERGRVGVVHAAGMPATSRLGWGRAALKAAGIPVRIEPVASASFERASTPPLRAVLASSDGVPEMDWRPVTRRYAAETLVAGRA